MPPDVLLWSLLVDDEPMLLPVPDVEPLWPIDDPLDGLPIEPVLVSRLVPGDVESVLLVLLPLPL